MEERRSYNEFDEVLTKKIGLGMYQYKAFFSFATVDFLDGFDVIAMAIIMPILQDEFKLDNMKTQVLASAFYFGMIIGAILVATIADRFGRKLTLIISGLL